jgi:membrane protein required for colicin V production
MPLFDSLVIIVLALSLIFSIIRGMVREVFSLLAYIGGYFLAMNYRADLSITLNKYISNTTASEIISFGLIFIVGVVGISLAGKLIKKLIHSAPGLSALDRAFGGILGVVKGVVILIILMFPLRFFPELNADITRGSYFAPHINDLSQMVARGVDSESLIESFPKIDLSEVKENIGAWKGLDKLAQDLKNKTNGSAKSEGLKGEPQDKYTEEDKDKLKDILLSLDKKKGSSSN